MQTSSRTGVLRLLARPLAMRSVALVVVATHILTIHPVVVQAQGRLLDPEIVVGSPLGGPGAQRGPTPPLDLLAAQPALSAPPKNPIARLKDIPVNRPVPIGVFSETPSAGELRTRSPLPLGLKPFGEATVDENAALARALATFKRRAKTDDFSPIQEFLDEHPNSAWRASILTNLGSLYAGQGFYTRAAAALQEAWPLVRDGKGIDARELASVVAGELALSLSRSGREEALKQLLKELEGRELLGASPQKILKAKAPLAPIEKPEQAGPNCGLVALGQLHRFKNPGKGEPSILTNKKERLRLALEPSLNGAMSLAQLKVVANLARMPMTAGKRTGDSGFPVPSILHWKRGHFSAVLQAAGDSYLVRDPALGGDIWMKKAALVEECSGYALIPGTKLPAGWIAPADNELSRVTGKNTPAPLCDDPDTCSPASSCDDGDTCGMPRARLHFAEASLRITDTPVSYTPAIGHSIDFTVTYSHRQSHDWVSYQGPNVGRLWTFDWLSYVEEQLSYHTTCACPPPPAGHDDQIPVYEGWFGKARVFNPGGGVETYDVDPNWSQMHRTHLLGLGECGFPPVFKRGPSSRAALFRTEGQIYDGSDRGHNGTHSDCCGTSPYSSDQSVYERIHPDGTKEIYSHRVNNRVYLTKIIHRSGRAYNPSAPENELSTKLIYDQNSFRLLQVIDAAGQVTELSYNSPHDPFLITGVSMLGGERTATLEYNSDRQLVRITDAVGMSSRFYYAQGDFIERMETPYGNTHFIADQDTDWRFVESIDPLGARQRVETRVGAVNDFPASLPDTAIPEVPGQNGPEKMSVRHDALNERNTYYWSKKAMQEIGNGALDRSKARVMHWLFNAAQGKITNVLAAERAPLEGWVWYTYEGQVEPFDELGSSQQPRQVARQLDDGTTQLWEYAYGNDGKVTMSRDPLGRQTEYAYIFAGARSLLQTIKQKTSAGYDTLASYSNFNMQGLPAAMTDAAGQSTSYTYTGLGQVKTVTRTRNGQQEVTTYNYYPGNASGGNPWRLKEVRGPGNVLLQEYAYDAVGRVQTVTGSDGYAVSYQYDKLDRLLRVTYPDTTYEQTIYSRLDATWQRDRLGRWTHTEHNAGRQVVGVTDPLGRRTSFEHCPCGTLEAIIDAKGQRTSFTYDLQLRVAEKIYADNSMLQYEYEDTTSRLKTMTDARGVVTTYGYKVDNNLASMSYSAVQGVATAPSVSYEYDPVYSRVTEVSTSGVDRIEYDYFAVGTLGAGRLQYEDRYEASAPTVRVSRMEHTYDAYGRELSCAVDGVADSRTYDALGRVDGATNALGSFTHAYVGNTGRLSSVSFPNGQTTAYGYWNNANDRRLDSIEHKGPPPGGGGSAPTLSLYAYWYNAVGNITTWSQDIPGLAQSYSFVYDAADQLVSARLRNPGTNVTLKQYGYGYDRAGNRTTEQIDSTVQTASYANELNQLSSLGGSGSVSIEGTVDEPATVMVGAQKAQVWKAGSTTYGWRADAALQAGTNNITISATDANTNQATKQAQITVPSASHAFAYDTAGNMTSRPDNGHSYTWDSMNRLVKITYSGGATTEFTYNGPGQRVRELEKNSSQVVTADRRLVWCGMQLRELRNSSNQVTKRYYAQGMVLGATTPADNSDKRFYTRDHLGSIRQMTSWNGSLVASYDYDPYGRKTKLAGNEEADFGYTGHYFHVPSGLHLAFYRAYDGGLGRWINRDPIQESDGLNLYRYCRNNPVRHKDLLGLRTLGIAGTINIKGCEGCGELIREIRFIPEDDRTAQLQPLPTGGKIDADAIYFPGGAYKIGDLGTVTVSCECNCKCLVFKISGHGVTRWKAGEPTPPVPDWPGGENAPPPYEKEAPPPPAQ